MAVCAAKTATREAAFAQTRLQVDRLKTLAGTQAVDIARLTGVLAVISEGVDHAGPRWAASC